MFANNETGVLQPIAEVVRLARAGRRAGALRCRAGRRQGARSICTVSASTISASRPTSSAARRASARWWCAAARRSRRTGGAAGRNPIVAPARRTWPASWASAPRPTAARERARWSTRLRDRLERSLLAIAPGARVFGAGAPRLANTTCISMPGVKAETQVMALDLAGVCVSAGAACSSGKVHRSAGAGGHGRRRCRGRDGDQNKSAAGTPNPRISNA